MDNQISLWHSCDDVIASYIQKVLHTEYAQSNVGDYITVDGSIMVRDIVDGVVVASDSVADLIKSNLTKSFHEYWFDIEYNTFNINNNYPRMATRGKCAEVLLKQLNIMTSFDNIKILDYNITASGLIGIHYSIDCYYKHATDVSVDYDFINEVLNKWHSINMVDASVYNKPLITKDASIIISVDRNGVVIGSMLSHITGIPAFNVTYNDVKSLCDERSLNQMLHAQIKAVMLYMKLRHYEDIIIVTDIKNTDTFEIIKHHANSQCTYVEPRFHYVYMDVVTKIGECVKFPWEK